MAWGFACRPCILLTLRLEVIRTLIIASAPHISYAHVFTLTTACAVDICAYLKLILCQVLKRMAILVTHVTGYRKQHWLVRRIHSNRFFIRSINRCSKKRESNRIEMDGNIKSVSTRSNRNFELKLLKQVKYQFERKYRIESKYQIKWNQQSNRNSKPNEMNKTLSQITNNKIDEVPNTINVCIQRNQIRIA